MFSLVALSAELAEQLVAVQETGDDAVHQARTRVRRLRSVLQVYRRAFQSTAARRLRQRLRELSTALGEVRDLQVRASALSGLAAAGTGNDGDDVLLRIADESGSAAESARLSLLADLRRADRRELLAELEAFASAPPLGEHGQKHPRRFARRALARAAAAIKPLGPDDTADRLHEARKAARRLRYAAEASVDVLGRSAVRLAAAAESLQESLGRARDLQLLSEFLVRRAAAPAMHSGEAEALTRLAADCAAQSAGILSTLPEQFTAITAA
ncbi:CHAD domain-containing protein [Leifsonia poae]|uniref:CHAD domain-containing protein n=1 Tax=Leifsonia poae TaxID=110933 RepID=UPI001CBBD6D7|nr:CHAD domain-containing protein [Leifsonia poae]